MAQNPSLSGIFLSGFILAGLPFVAIAKHWHVAAQDARFEMPSQLTIEPLGSVDIQSEINKLDLSELTGTDNVREWDTVYVHMAYGPNLIAYPFGISKTKPRIRKGDQAFALRGTVTKKEDTTITVHYNFETFSPSGEMKPLLFGDRAADTKVEIAVNRASVARLVAVEVDGVRYPYRVMEKPVLKGLTR